MKTVYLLRGVSGSGKSSLAKELTTSGGVVCCADDYFMVDGQYQFNAEKLGNAHYLCKAKFTDALAVGITPVVVANTNTTEKQFKEYDSLAKVHGYQVFYLVVENRHGGTNVHNVPAETLKKQEDCIRSSLKLV